MKKADLIKKLENETITKEEAVELVKLMKKSGGSGSASKTEDDLRTPDKCHFVPDTLRKADDGTHNVVDAICMMADPDGTATLERDFRPTFRKPSPREGQVREALALDAGTQVCGAIHVRGTGDLHHSFYCPDCKSKAASKSREARGAYNTQVMDRLKALIAEEDEGDAVIDLD
jgi:hypothetical protein